MALRSPRRRELKVGKVEASRLLLASIRIGMTTVCFWALLRLPTKEKIFDLYQQDRNPHQPALSSSECGHTSET